MNNSLIIKYKPISLDDFNISDYTKELINIYLKNKKLLFLIHGGTGHGKSSLINVLINKYYKNDKSSISNNTIYINLLKEQGINYYRNELKNYCQINNLMNLKEKKTIILDDLDLLNEQCQQIFNTFINNYENINFIISCNDKQKIKSTIINKLELIKLNNIDDSFITKRIDKILEKEDLKLDNKCKKLIIRASNMSIPNMINNIEKLNLIMKDDVIDYDLLENVSCNIMINDMSKYIKLCKEDNFKASIDHILNMCNNGFSVIDILQEMFLYIKFHSDLDDKYKYDIIKLICKYINIFHNIHEDSIELIFLTNNIRNIFNINII
jgi:DNA polymerase III delta prime subunit